MSTTKTTSDSHAAFSAGSVQLREHNMEALVRLAAAAPDGAYYVPGSLD